MKDSASYSRYVDQDQDTRWASEEEIKETALRIDLSADIYPGAGLPLLVEGTDAYVDNNDTHTIIFGSTGSKKTRLFCMPMLNYFAHSGESFIATDPKGELYAKTSGLVKAKGYKTVILNFRDIGHGDMWNPLALPYDLYHNGKRESAISIVNDFISTLAAPHSYRNDAFWSTTASALGLANILLLLEYTSADKCNIGSFAKLSSAANQNKVIEIAESIDENSLIGMNYKGVLLKEADTTRDCIFASLFAMVRIFIAQENLTRMLSGNSFDIRNIGREKTAVYIIVPDEKTTYHFLVTTFIKQVYEILINEAQKEQNFKLPVRVNYILDEFCNIPEIPDMPSMISAARSRNMRFFLVAQSLHQLKSKYGEDANTIKGNCDNWVFITSKELDLLNEISELCGSRRNAYNRKKKLISSSELQRFDKSLGEVLIMHCRQYPIVVELPDIDNYEMFKGYETVPLKPFVLPEVNRINFDDILRSVRSQVNNYEIPHSTKNDLAGADIDGYGFEEILFDTWKSVVEIISELIEDNVLEMFECCLFKALAGAIYLDFPEEQRNLKSLIELLKLMEVHDNDAYRDGVDYYFEELKDKEKDALSIILYNYDCYKSLGHQKRNKVLFNCIDKMQAYMYMHVAG